MAMGFADPSGSACEITAPIPYAGVFHASVSGSCHPVTGVERRVVSISGMGYFHLFGGCRGVLFSGCRTDDTFGINFL